MRSSQPEFRILEKDHIDDSKHVKKESQSSPCEPMDISPDSEINSSLNNNQFPKREISEHCDHKLLPSPNIDLKYTTFSTPHSAQNALNNHKPTSEFTQLTNCFDSKPRLETIAESLKLGNTKENQRSPSIRKKFTKKSQNHTHKAHKPRFYSSSLCTFNKPKPVRPSTPFPQREQLSKTDKFSGQSTKNSMYPYKSFTPMPCPARIPFQTHDLAYPPDHLYQARSNQSQGQFPTPLYHPAPYYQAPPPFRGSPDLPFLTHHNTFTPLICRASNTPRYSPPPQQFQTSPEPQFTRFTNPGDRQTGIRTSDFTASVYNTNERHTRPNGHTQHSYVYDSNRRPSKPDGINKSNNLKSEVTKLSTFNKQSSIIQKQETPTVKIINMSEYHQVANEFLNKSSSQSHQVRSPRQTSNQSSHSSYSSRQTVNSPRQKSHSSSNFPSQPTSSSGQTPKQTRNTLMEISNSSNQTTCSTSQAPNQSRQSSNQHMHHSSPPNPPFETPNPSSQAPNTHLQICESSNQSLDPSSHAPKPSSQAPNTHMQICESSNQSPDPSSHAPNPSSQAPSTHMQTTENNVHMETRSTTLPTLNIPQSPTLVAPPNTPRRPMSSREMPPLEFKGTNGKYHELPKSSPRSTPSHASPRDTNRSLTPQIFRAPANSRPSISTDGSNGADNIGPLPSNLEHMCIDAHRHSEDSCVCEKRKSRKRRRSQIESDEDEMTSQLSHMSVSQHASTPTSDQYWLAHINLTDDEFTFLQTRGAPTLSEVERTTHAVIKLFSKDPMGSPRSQRSAQAAVSCPTLSGFEDAISTVKSLQASLVETKTGRDG